MCTRRLSTLLTLLVSSSAIGTPTSLKSGQPAAHHALPEGTNRSRGRLLVSSILDRALISQISPCLSDANQWNAKVSGLLFYRWNGPTERGRCSQSSRSTVAQHFQPRDSVLIPRFRNQTSHCYFSNGRNSPFSQPSAWIAGSGSRVAWMKLHFGHS
jgi:hypothetical protein